MRPLSALASRIRRLTLVLGLALFASSCNTYEKGIPLPDILDEINATLAPNLLLLQEGDELTVKFRAEEIGEKYDQQLRIGPDGKAVFKGLVEIDAVGMSADELDATLERLIEEKVQDASLEIEITKLSNREVLFIGSMKTRVVSVLPELRAEFIESMARIRAEGTTFTLLESVILIRWMHDEQRRRYWIIDAREQFWTNPELLYLQAGDIVYFPDHPIKRTGDWIRELTRLLPLPQIFQFS